MPRFEPKTFTTILTRMANRIVARTALTDLEDGGNLHTILSSVARELDDISFQQVQLRNIWDIDTATGEDLDDRALDYPPDRILRESATYGVGTYQFSRSGTTGAVVIPAGTVVRVPGGGPEFTTQAAATIADTFTDSTIVAIIATEAGEDGNVDVNTITQIEAVAGVETGTNVTATTGGRDEETDAEFRARIKAYIRSLSRGTPDALKYAVLDTSLPSLGRIVSAEILELPAPDLGVVHVFVDDGTGTIETTQNNTGSPETVIASAAGGEERLFLDNVPVKIGQPVTIEKNAVGLTEGVDYTLDRSTGQITLTVALVATDAVTAEYTWVEGLIEEAQKIINGDPSDRANYPGYRAAGTQVFVLAPTVQQQVITAGVTLEDGFDSAEVFPAVSAAINRYVNNLPINGDVILSELIAAAQGVPGVFDVAFTSPTANVIIGEGELARVLDANITIT